MACRTPAVGLKGTYFRFQYTDGTEFVIDRRGGRIWATWSAAGTVEDMATYLLGPVLGFVLRLRLLYAVGRLGAKTEIPAESKPVRGDKGPGKEKFYKSGEDMGQFRPSWC